MRSIPISRQLILGISLPCSLTHIPDDQRRWNRLLILTLLRLRLILVNLPSPSVRRRPLLHTLSNRIQRHPRPLASLALNSTGTLLATSSEKGTVIWVWCVPGAEKLYQFRRGTREVRI